MKTKLLSIIFCAAALTACSNVDDTFELSDDIIVSSLQTVDTMAVLPTDTVRFKFLVSTNRGSIRNLQLDVDESVVERVPEKTTFALIDANDTLYVDAEGNLSRDVSTVVAEYPVVIKQNPEILKNTYLATLRATNAAGKSATNYTHFKGTNLRRQTKALGLQTGWRLYPTTKIFVDPVNYKSYSCVDLMVDKDDEESKNDSIEKVKNIDFIVGFWYNFANPDDETYRLFSPDSKEAKDFIINEANAPYIANSEQMNHTVFYRLDGLGGSTLDEQIEAETDFTKKYQLWNDRNTLDQKFFDDEIDDDFVSKLDFSNAKDFLYLKGGLYAFKTGDGRKGVFIVTYYSAFGHYAQIPVQITRLAIQSMTEQ